MTTNDIQARILAGLKRVPLGQLARVLEIMDRGSHVPTDGAANLESVARSVVHLPVRGSKLDAVLRAVILHALVTCDDNVSAAARLVGMDRKAFERKARKYRRESKRG